jgi:hypothetical protein
MRANIAAAKPPNAGNYVRKIGGGFGYEGEVPLAKGKRCFSVNGFSLHANTAIHTHARDRLSKLIEYIAPEVPYQMSALTSWHYSFGWRRQASAQNTGQTASLIWYSRISSSHLRVYRETRGAYATATQSSRALVWRFCAQFTVQSRHHTQARDQKRIPFCH